MGLAIREQFLPGLYFYFFKLIYFEAWGSTRMREWGGAEGDRKRKFPKWVLHWLQSPMWGLELTNYEIMTWAEIKSWTLNQLSHPSTPRTFSSKCTIWPTRRKLGSGLTLNADWLRKASLCTNEANWNLCLFCSSLRVVMRGEKKQNKKQNLMNNGILTLSLWEVNSDKWQIRKMKGRNQYLLLLCSKLWDASDERDRCCFSNHTVWTLVVYKLLLSRQV